MDQLGLRQDDVDTILLGDARLTIADAGSGFDLVIADAFGGFVVPWHLTTVEFLREVSATMAPEGVFLMNLIDYPPAAFARAEVATIAEVFDHVVVLAPTDYFSGDRGGNYVIVASNAPLDIAAIAEVAALSTGGEVARSEAPLADWIGDASVLTDDYAPVDQLITR